MLKILRKSSSRTITNFLIKKKRVKLFPKLRNSQETLSPLKREIFKNLESSSYVSHMKQLCFVLFLIKSIVLKTKLFFVRISNNYCAIESDTFLEKLWPRFDLDTNEHKTLLFIRNRFITKTLRGRKIEKDFWSFVTFLWRSTSNWKKTR